MAKKIAKDQAVFGQEEVSPLKMSVRGQKKAEQVKVVSVSKAPIAKARRSGKIKEISLVTPVNSKVKSPSSDKKRVVTPKKSKS